MSILSTYLQLLVLNGDCAVALGGQGAKNEARKMKLLQKKYAYKSKVNDHLSMEQTKVNRCGFYI